MLVGYDEKIRAFRKLVADERVGHAYLFFGDAGVGKNAFARAFAHFLEEGTFEAADAPLIDALWCTPVEGTIGIDAVRALRTFLSQTPLRSSRRLAVVDDAHCLTPEAQSGMLKIVEEPPSRSLIIFIAHDSQVLLPPLLSRLTKVYFPRLSDAALLKALTGTFGIPAARARAIAPRSFGRVGRALALSGKEEVPADESLAGELDEKILSLWEKGPERNAPALAYLLDRSTSLKRYNLNENLQRKAVQAHLAHRP